MVLVNDFTYQSLFYLLLQHLRPSLSLSRADPPSDKHLLGHSLAQPPPCGLGDSRTKGLRFRGAAVL